MGVAARLRRPWFEREPHTPAGAGDAGSGAAAFGPRGTLSCGGPSYNACRVGARFIAAHSCSILRHPHSADEASMDGYIRSEREEYFEQLCISVDADEAHEQEAIEYFENQFDQPDFDPAQWLDIALYYSPAVARGIVDMVTPDDKARSNIAEVIADNLDISYGEEECQQFAETIEFALNNGVPVDLDLVLDGCQRAIDDLDTWADDETKAPLLRLREEVLRQQGER
jgi:hypothetical protein